MRIRQVVVIGFVLFLAACTTPIDVGDVSYLGPLAASTRIGFVPVEPIPATGEVEIARGGKIETTDIRLLTKAEALALFADTRSKITVAKVNSNGQLSYLTGSITGEKGTYVAHMDFTNFFVDDLVDDSTQEKLGRARVGIGLRLVAQVKTKKKGIDLGGLLKIGLAASKSELHGSLEVRAIGLTSAEILSLLPGVLPSVDETSIQSALEAMAAVKAKIYENDTVISARVIAIELDESADADSISFLHPPDPVSAG